MIGMALGLALLAGPGVAEPTPSIVGKWCALGEEREGVGCFVEDEACLSFSPTGEALLPDLEEGVTATWHTEGLEHLIRIYFPGDTDPYEYPLRWAGEELALLDVDGEEMLLMARQGDHPACTATSLENERERTNEAKSRSRAIVLALERFAQDHGGFYPHYIWGGSVESWSCHLSTDCSIPKEQIPDPLIAGGYLDYYPDNPFVMWRHSTCGLTGEDPRFGCLPGDGSIISDGTGPEASALMANTLSDPLVSSSVAPTGLPYYFAGDGDPLTQDYLPGNFIYRALVLPVEVPGGCPEEGCPLQAVGYMLGIYGGLANGRGDWLHCLNSEGEYGDTLDTPNCTPADMWDAEATLLIASEMGPWGSSSYQPCPEVAVERSCRSGVLAGHPDGYPDGVVILLSNIADYLPPIGPGHGWTPRQYGRTHAETLHSDP